MAEEVGVDGQIADAAGQFGDIYKLGDKYGSEFWDAAGGDFSGFMDIGEAALPAYAINQTFGQAFASGGPQEAVGSQMGQAAGMYAAGPFGMIVGGMFGAIAGDMFNQLMGNADVDYDIKTSQGTDGFEDGVYLSTPFGNIGFNSSSTRNLSMGKEGKGILSAYAKMLGPIDYQLASVLTPDELTQVRKKVERNIDNSHKYGPEDTMKYLLKDRMTAIDSTMSDARKKETGWDTLLAQYNAGYAPVTRTNLDTLSDIANRISRSTSANSSGWLGSDVIAYSDDGKAAQAELEAILQSDPHALEILDMANKSKDPDGNLWWQPMGIVEGGKSYYDRIDETNARYRV